MKTHVSLPPQIVAALEEYAKRQHRPESFIVELALVQYLRPRGFEFEMYEDRAAPPAPRSSTKLRPARS